MTTRRFVRAQAPAFNSRRSWRSVEAAGRMPAGLFFNVEGNQADGIAADAKLGRHACEIGMARDCATARRRLLAFLLFAVMVGSDGPGMIVLVSDVGGMEMGCRFGLNTDAMPLMRKRPRCRDRKYRDRHCKAECPKDADPTHEPLPAVIYAFQR